MKHAALAAIFMIFLLVLGIYTNSTSNTVQTAPNDVMEISPSQLFQGDTKKLEPHLGWTAGAVKIKYGGSKEYLKISYEIWENGALKQRSGAMATSIDSMFDGEVSVSLKELQPEGQTQKYNVNLVISEPNGYSRAAFTIDKFDGNLIRGLSPMTWPKTEVVDADKEVAVWGLMAANKFRTGNSIEEQAKNVDWAFVVKISIQ